MLNQVLSQDGSPERWFSNTYFEYTQKSTLFRVTGQSQQPNENRIHTQEHHNGVRLCCQSTEENSIKYQLFSFYTVFEKYLPNSMKF